MRDPFGTILILVRDDPAVAAIVSTRVSSQPEAPPSVQIIDNNSTRHPFGPGSGRLGAQLWIGFARCFGPDSPTGAITARQLAGAVSDALHDRDKHAGSTYLYKVYASEITGLTRDPDTNWPHYDVRIEAFAAAQAVA